MDTPEGDRSRAGRVRITDVSDYPQGRNMTATEATLRDENLAILRKFILDPTVELREAVFQAIGAASVCWEGVPRGTFKDDEARAIAEGLLLRITGQTNPYFILTDDALANELPMRANAYSQLAIAWELRQQRLQS